MKMSQVTGLGRPLDLRYPTNLAIALISFTVAGTAACIDGTPLSGLRAGLDIFFAWALCRELDPEHDLAAFVAVGLSIFGLVNWGQSAAPLFWLLLAIRTLNRTTGRACTVLDSLLLLGLGVFSGWGALTAFVLGADAMLPQGRKFQLVFAAAAAAGAIWRPFPHLIAGPALWESLVLAFLFLPVVYHSRKSRSVCDVHPRPLWPARVQAAQLFALLVACLSASRTFHGQLVPNLTAQLPLWSALLAAAVWRLRATLIWPEEPRETAGLLISIQQQSAKD